MKRFLAEEGKRAAAVSITAPDSLMSGRLACAVLLLSVISGCAMDEQRAEDMNKRYLAERNCRGEVQTTGQISVSSDPQKGVVSGVATACVPPELDNKSEYEKNKEWENRDKLQNPRKR